MRTRMRPRVFPPEPVVKVAPVEKNSTKSQLNTN